MEREWNATWKYAHKNLQHPVMVLHRTFASQTNFHKWRKQRKNVLFVTGQKAK